MPLVLLEVINENGSRIGWLFLFGIFRGPRRWLAVQHVIDQPLPVGRPALGGEGCARRNINLAGHAGFQVEQHGLVSPLRRFPPDNEPPAIRRPAESAQYLGIIVQTAAIASYDSEPVSDGAAEVAEKQRNELAVGRNQPVLNVISRWRQLRIF